MGITAKHALFVVLAVGSTIFAWSHALAWMAGGGNILNLPQFFLDAYHSGPAAAFLTIDILVAWIVYMIWVVGEATMIGLGAKWDWLFVALSVLGTCFAFPLDLVTRERFLANVGRSQ